jgi:hypothetical protein
MAGCRCPAAGCGWPAGAGAAAAARAPRCCSQGSTGWRNKNGKPARGPLGIFAAPRARRWTGSCRESRKSGGSGAAARSCSCPAGRTAAGSGLGRAGVRARDFSPCAGRRRAAACVATYRVAQPLHGRDADGAVKGAWPNRQAVAQVCQAHVAFNLALCRHLQHGGADVHALQAAAGRRCLVHLQSACSSACCAVLPLPPRCTTPPPLQRAHHPGVPVVAKRLSTEAGAAPQVEQEPRGAVAGQRQQLERSLREGRLDGYHARVIRVLTRFIVIIKYLRGSCMLWPVALAHGSLLLFEYYIRMQRPGARRTQLQSEGSRRSTSMLHCLSRRWRPLTRRRCCRSMC